MVTMLRDASASERNHFNLLATAPMPSKRKGGRIAINMPKKSSMYLNKCNILHFYNGAPTRNRTSIYGLGNHCFIR